jgi:GAF domain-containing protein
MPEYTLVAEKTGELRLDAAAKEARYGEVSAHVEAVLAGERDLLACMASAACLLHSAFPYYYWTGFYRRVSEDALLVGPYQGTLGCLRIDLARGVCGLAARERRTVVVDDVDAFPGHIACDAASRSEIVVPLLDGAGRLLAVLDVDSTIPAAFDDVDRRHLEHIVALLSDRSPEPLAWTGGAAR